MRIASLHPEGFGPFSDYEVGPFTAPVTVIHGHNEAGKSTLLAFIRTILFGFPVQNRAKHYPALFGGRHGGRIVLVDDDGGRYVVERTEMTGSVSLRITLPDGSQVSDEEALTPLLGSRNRQLFESVFAFNLLDLQRLDSIEKAEMAQHIYAAGMGAERLPRALSDLVTDAGAIFKPGGSIQTIARLLRDAGEIDSELDRLKGEASEYAQLTAEADRLRTELAELEREIARSAREVRETERLSRAWGDWMRRDGLQRQLASLPDLGDFPGDALVRLEQVRAAIRDATEAAQDVAAEIGRLEEQIARPIADESLLADATAAEDIRRQRGALEGSVSALPNRLAERGQAQERLDESLRSLGPGWDDQRVMAFDDSTPVRDAIAQWQTELDRAWSSEREAALRDEAVGERLREARETEERAARELASHPAPDVTAAEIDARRELLASARTRLSELATATLDRRQLEAQQAVLEATVGDAGPARRGSSALVPAVLGIAAVASVGAGLAAGGAGLGIMFAVAIVLAGAGVAAWVGGQRTRRAAAGNRLVEVPGLQDARATENRLQAEVAELAAKLDCAPNADALNRVERVLEQASAALAARAGDVARFETAANERQQVERRKAESERTLEQAGSKRESAANGWRLWLADHGLTDTLTPATALTICERVSGLKEQVRGLAAIDDRIGKIRADIEADARRISEFASLCGQRVDPSSFGTLVGMADSLLRRFDAARDAARRREQLREQLALHEATGQRQKQRLAAAREARMSLLEACRAEDEAELEARAGQHAQRRELEAGLANVEAALRAVSGPGEAHERLQSALSETDAAGIEARLAETEATAKALAERRTERNEQLWSAERRLEELATDSRASDLRTRRADLTEELRVATGDWSRLTIARVLLERARKKFEQERQPEVIRSAQGYFSTITAGRYDRVRAPLGQQTIEVFPADGSAARSPSQLSQGTQEQLYLAMRFGLIEQFARQRTVLPVVVDEILVNFDPERALATARAFSQLSERHQVLVFTCHPWVVDLFREANEATQVIDLDERASLRSA